MRYGPSHKAETRERILEAATRSFGRHGYDGIGVDGLAQEAGITSGAFYGHFRSKAEVFQDAAVAGLTRLRRGIQEARSMPGPWVKRFMDHYLAPPFRQGSEGGCALPSLSGEVARAAPGTKAAYEAEMLRLRDEIAGTLEPGAISAETRAWAMMALLAGGATLARAVQDCDVAQQIADAVKSTVLHVTGDPA